MAWLSLIPLVIVCWIGAWLSYAPGMKEKSWYTLAFTGLAAASGWLFGWAMQRTTGDRDAFLLSFVWDVLVTAVYVVVPVVVFGVRMTAWGWCGLILAVVGVLMLKMGVGK